MAVKRFSNSLISQSGQDKVTNFIAGYSPAVDEMDLIQRTTVGISGSTSVDFVSIPQTYQHLQIRGVCRNSIASDGLWMRVNGDTSNNYSYHLLYGNGSSAAAASGASVSQMAIANQTYSTSLANTFSCFIIDILDYTSTNKNKTIRAISGYDTNGLGEVRIASGLWINTSSINSFSFRDANGNNLVQYSTFSLYGVVS